MTEAGRARGKALAAAALIFPALVYVAVFRWLARGLGPSWGDAFPAPTGFAPPSAALVASDLAAREAFALAAAAMLMISLGAIAYALAGLHRAHGPAGLAAGVAMTVFAGGLAVIDEGNPFRTVLVDRALHAAVEAGALFAPERTPEALARFVRVNTFFGIGAVGAMVLRFAALGLPAEGPDAAEALAARNAAARTSLMVGGLILTSAAATTYFFYHFPVALMEGEAQATQRAFASIASTRWGAVYTAVLIATAAPAFAAIHLDARDAVEGGAVAPEEAAPLLGVEAVFGGPLKAFGALVATLAPAAIGPLLGLLEPILKLHGG